MSENAKSLPALIEYFYKWEEVNPKKTYLRQPIGDNWKTYSWAEVGQQARCMANALKNMGLKPGDHIGIFSKNCCHWIMADIAIMIGGFISVPLYATLGKDELNEVLVNGDVDALFVGKLEDWNRTKSGVPEHIKLISFPHYQGSAKVEAPFTWDKLIEENEPMEGHPVPNLYDPWTIIFTSGTTGTPKGVVLSHQSPAALLHKQARFDDFHIKHISDVRSLSYLPLNHMAERVAIEMASMLCCSTISFAESIESFNRNLCDTQPTVFLAVPRIWAKFQSAVFEKIPPKRLATLLKIPIVSGIIKKKIKTSLGLRDVEEAFSGAAPLTNAIKLWYRKLGINIRDVYGLTETNIATMIPYDSKELGSVGKALAGVNMKIEENTGEICLKSGFNMIEYYKEPELTQKVIKDGWVHTGDKGAITEDGYLKIVGRIRDTFKTSKAKFITPAELENKFAHIDLIEQVCVVGRGIPQPFLLCTLSPSGLAEDIGVVTDKLQKELGEINEGLINYKKLALIVIAKGGWTTENQIMTPTLKIKRDQIEKRYAGSYEKWYSSGKEVVWESE